MSGTGKHSCVCKSALQWLSRWFMLQPLQRQICFAANVCFYRVFWDPLVWKKNITSCMAFPQNLEEKEISGGEQT